MGKILLVIPPTVRAVRGNYEVEDDCINNLEAYLENFEQVTFACPISAETNNSGILRSRPLPQIKGSDRLTYLALPFPYREDKYLKHYLRTRSLLKAAISKADYLIFSPHSQYDWPTLGVRIATQMARKYAVEADWDHSSVRRLHLRAMPFGVRKLRRSVEMRLFSRNIKYCLAHSSIALLQGEDVYRAYMKIAPNPKKVLNVQVSAEDYISQSDLKNKQSRARAGKKLTVAYAGRMDEMKGPLDWLNAVQGAVAEGVELEAIWFGDGPLMSKMREEVRRLGVEDCVSLPGVVGREELMARLRTTEIFLFCHKTRESPRCLGEALAAACVLVGYRSEYPRDLVAAGGGGEFADIGDWKALASIIVSLDKDRPRLGGLLEAAAASGKLLDRNTAMQERIDLIKRYLA